MTKQEKKLTASQRIEKIEKNAKMYDQNFQTLAQEIDTLRQTMSALARRLNATVKAGENGSISDDAVNSLLVEENTSELKGKVDFLIKQGVLSTPKLEEIHDKSFIIGSELDEESEVINPRIQFALPSIVPETILYPVK